ETTSNDQFNLDIDRLARDLQNLLVTLYTPSSSASEGASAMPELFLVGHSMGGSVVTEVATRELVPNISGFAVLDMQEVYKSTGPNNIRLWCETRPAVCENVEQAIQWGMAASIIRNPESARVSFPGMVKRSPTDSTYTWRTDLLASEHLWLTWFDRLNEKFLSAKPKKLLILGGHGFFDDEMKAAHEQNRFKYSIFTDSGHAVQEDDPVRMAKELVEFWKND
ncbi:Protein with carboxyl methyl esterase activity, partial [Haplosporangium sp. Z 27]